MGRRKVLSVRDLEISFATSSGSVSAIRGVRLDLYEGETLAIVGESGSGKSVTTKAILGILSENGKIEKGSIQFTYERDGEEVTRDLTKLSDQEMQRHIRGKRIAMVFQDPMTSLNPYMKIGEQLMEVLQLHKGYDKQTAFAESVKMLDAVKMPEAKKRMGMYPHEFSGGMRQRVMIAMALLCRPKLLIADEPTTALDVTVQAQIMTLLNELKREFNTAIIMITHDLGVVAGICDQVMVMYAGRTMEYGTAEQIFYHPTHPYSIGLMDAIPRLDGNEEHLVTIPGNPPNLLHLPKGCPFSPRCQFATEQCQTAPKLTTFNHGQLRNCWLPVEKFTL